MMATMLLALLCSLTLPTVVPIVNVFVGPPVLLRNLLNCAWASNTVNARTTVREVTSPVFGSVCVSVVDRK